MTGRHVHRVLVVDTLTLEVVASIAQQAWTTLEYSTGLNDHATVTLTLPISDPRCNDIILPWDGSRCLLVERDLQIVASGILWEVEPDQDQVTFRATGILELLEDRYLRDGVVLTGTEQFQAVRDIMTQVQRQQFGRLSGSLAVDVTAASTTVTRTGIEWKQQERKPARQAIEDLSKLPDGFDFEVEHHWHGVHADDRFLARELLLWWPQRTRTTGIVLEHGRNCTAERYRLDGRARANLVDVIGETVPPEGQTAQPIIVTAWVESTAHRPMVEEIVTDRDLHDPGTVGQRAQAEVTRLNAPVVWPQITLRPDVPPDVNQFELGDLVEVRLRDSYTRVAEACRIVEISVSVDRAGMTVQLLPVSVQAAPLRRPAATRIISGLAKRVDQLERRFR